MLNVKRVLVESLDGKEVWVTPAQATALDSLSEMQGGGCAGLHGYKPTTGYVESPVVDIQMLTRFSYTRLIERKRDVLEGITFADVQPAIAKNDKLSALTVVKANEVFEARKQMELDSIERTLSGDRSDAHRQGHDRCYATFAGGIKGHLVTEKVDGLMEPVTLNGTPILNNIMINYLELNRKVVKEGVRKPKPNSGAPVLMGNAIKSLLNKRSVGFKSASLKDDNFESLVMSKTEFLPEDVAPNVLELLKD